MRKAGLDRATTGLQGAHGGAGGGRSSTDRCHHRERWLRRAWQAGPRPAHLSLPFWMEAWPRLALSKSGEFLLRFVLVERTLFCGKQRTRLCPESESVFRAGSQHPLPLHLPPRVGAVRKERVLLLLGG